MKKTFMPSLLAGCSMLLMTSATLTAADGSEEVAQKAAEAWLLLTDQGKFEESWKAAAEVFQKSVTKEQWEKALAMAREPLGDLISRELKSAEATDTLLGAPEGDYVVLQFTTSFANKKEAVETVTPMLGEDGKWRVSGYFIK